MKKVYTILYIFVAIMVITIAIADITANTIPKTNYNYNVSKLNTTQQQEVISKLKGITISDINCNSKDICTFVIRKDRDSALAYPIINGRGKSDIQILAERDRLIGIFLEKYLNTTNIVNKNIGGEGNISIVGVRK